MNNLYFYTYYLFMRFFKRVNPKDLDTTFTGMSLLSMLIGIIIFSLFSLVGKPLLTKSNTLLVSLMIAVPVLLINYFLLYRRSEKITEYYDKKYQNKPHSMLIIILIIVFVIIVFVGGGYLAYLQRNHRI